MQKNFFFKWLYQLEDRKKDVLEYLTDAIQVNIVKKSIPKFKSWKRKGGATEKKFNAHHRSIEKKFYPNGGVEKAVNKLNEKMVDFLIVDEHKTSKLLRHKTLFEAANRHNFSTEYFYHLEKRKEINEAEELRSFDYWYERFKVNYHLFFHPEFIKHKRKTIINEKTYETYVILQDTWDDLQKAILIHKLRMACEIRSWKWLYNDTFEDFNFDEINRDIEFFRKNIKGNNLEKTETISDNSQAIHIYADLFEWLALDSLEDIEGFNRLKTNVIKNISIFPNDEQVAILIMLINYITKLFEQKEKIEEVKEMLYEVARYGFKAEIFGITYLDSNLFLNIFDMLYKDYPDFTDEMLEKYSRCIISDEKLFVELFCAARIAAREKDWYKALENAVALNHLNNYTFAFRKGIATITFQYEIRELWEMSSPPNNFKGKKAIDGEDIKDTCDAFYISLSSTKFHKRPNTEEKQKVINFIKGIKLLVSHAASIDEIKSVLDDTPQMMAYEWFESKVKLRKSHKKSTSTF